MKSTMQMDALGVIVLKPSAGFDCALVGAKLRTKVPSGWLRDCWSLLDALPRTTLGKADKLILRTMLSDRRLTGARSDDPRPLPDTQMQNEGDRHERGRN